MKMLFIPSSIFILALIVALIVAPLGAYAGGGCSGGGGRGGSAQGESALMKKHRLQKDYETAQRIFEGKIPLRPRVTIIAKEQNEIFSKYKGRIPHTSSDYTRIDELTGRLSREQVEAVKHYLSTLYPIEAPSAEELRLARWQQEKAAMEKKR